MNKSNWIIFFFFWSVDLLNEGNLNKSRQRCVSISCYSSFFHWSCVYNVRACVYLQHIFTLFSKKKTLNCSIGLNIYSNVIECVSSILYFYLCLIVLFSSSSFQLEFNWRTQTKREITSFYVSILCVCHWFCSNWTTQTINVPHSRYVLRLLGRHFGVMNKISIKQITTNLAHIQMKHTKFDDKWSNIVRWDLIFCCCVFSYVNIVNPIVDNVFDVFFGVRIVDRYGESTRNSFFFSSSDSVLLPSLFSNSLSNSVCFFINILVWYDIR